jgi:hypothetical protein
MGKMKNDEEQGIEMMKGLPPMEATRADSAALATKTTVAVALYMFFSSTMLITNKVLQLRIWSLKRK